MKKRVPGTPRLGGEKVRNLCRPSFLKIAYLFLIVLGLCCPTWAFFCCGNQELLFIAVHRLLIAVACLVAEHRLQAQGL